MTDTETKGGTRERIQLPSELTFGKATRSIPKPRRVGRTREKAFYEILANVETAAQEPGETFQQDGLEDARQVEKVARYVREAAKELTRQAREDDKDAPAVEVSVHPIPDEGCVLFLVKAEANGDAEAEVGPFDDDDDVEDDDDDEDWDD